MNDLERARLRRAIEREAIVYLEQAVRDHPEHGRVLEFRVREPGLSALRHLVERYESAGGKFPPGAKGAALEGMLEALAQVPPAGADTSGTAQSRAGDDGVKT